jgi:anti-sigma B factor antagonist
MDLSIVSEARDQARVVRIGGDLDVYTAPQLKATLEECGLGKQTLVLDLSKVHFIDSTALASLVSAQQRSRAADQEFFLVMEDPYLLKVFRITGFESLFSIFPGVDDALEAI